MKRHLTAQKARTTTTTKTRSSRAQKNRVVDHPVMDSLTPLEERVIRMRYGLTVSEGATLKSQGGEAFQLKDRLHRIEAKILDSAVQVFGDPAKLGKKQRIISALRK